MRNLRARKRRAGSVGSLFFWRDRTREVDFVVDVAGKLELLEAKWNEVPTVADSVNLEFVRNEVASRELPAARSFAARPKATYSATAFGHSLWSTSVRFVVQAEDKLMNKLPRIATVHLPSSILKSRVDSCTGVTL